MKIYNVRYQSFNDNSLTEEIVAAVSERAAISHVISKGTPISAKISTSNNVSISRDYRQQFLLAILFHVKSGLSAGKALEEIIKAETGAIRPQLNPSLYILLAGGAFSDAVMALGMYDSATVAVLRAGERIGAMQQALKSAVDHYEKSAASKKMLYGVLFTLSIDIALSVASTLGIQFSFLPMVEKEGIKGTPEIMAQFSQNLSIAYAINGFLSLVTIAAIIGIGWIVYAYKQTSNAKLRYSVDRWLASTYLIKDVFSHSAIAMTFSMCGTLLKGGVSLHQSIEIIKGIALSPLVEEYWQTASQRLESGEPVAIALKSPLLDSSETLIITAHKDSLQLAEAFSGISVKRDELAMRANKKFGMVAFMGAMAYSSISVLIALWASYLQYTAMMSSMMSGGG